MNDKRIDDISWNDEKNLIAQRTEARLETVFMITEYSLNIQDEAVADEVLPSEALTKYLQHVGLCRRKKRKRCLSQELYKIIACDP